MQMLTNLKIGLTMPSKLSFQLYQLLPAPILQACEKRILLCHFLVWMVGHTKHETLETMSCIPTPTNIQFRFFEGGLSLTLTKELTLLSSVGREENAKRKKFLWKTQTNNPPHWQGMRTCWCGECGTLQKVCAQWPSTLRFCRKVKLYRGFHKCHSQVQFALATVSRGSWASANIVLLSHSPLNSVPMQRYRSCWEHCCLHINPEFDFSTAETWVLNCCSSFCLK